MTKQTCCIGVMAYNEEANIGKLLQALTQQQITSCHLQEIVVVASGCTDGTVEVANQWAEQDSRITVLAQEKREGKASAINLFIQHVQSPDVLVLESADTLPADDQTIERLIKPLCEDQRIGITGSHPVPVNSSETFLGFVVNLQWRLHHRIALISPKMGELIAFKNVISGIPPDTAVDEACIEALLVPQNYSLHYVPEAIVYNKGPETVKDFLIQRRRIAAGHTHLHHTQGYTVSTLAPLRTLQALSHELVWTPRALLWTVGAIVLEVYGRLLGLFDFYITKKNPYAWDIATTTKILED